MAKARLFINGSECDLGGSESLLLFTYAASDLDAPAVVQNSYSKEITLPPTATNAQIFGAMWRVDKIAGSDDAFRALNRTPFEIRSDAAEVMESGYCKLLSASAAEGYTIQLFGGLGAFLYGLMYNTDGSKKSLADLTWGDFVDYYLSFNIRESTIAAAWDRLRNFYDGTINSPYDVINFAPMHNGKPSDFDCNKALVPTGAGHGCPLVGTNTGKNGYALVEFSNEVSEWDVRDLRSYLQRPVFNMRALFYALENAANNGGYTFNWSEISNKWFSRLWMTLPMLDASGVTQEQTTLTTTWGATSIADIKTGAVLPITIAESLTTTSKVSASFGVALQLNYSYAGNISALSLGVKNNCTYIFARLIGYDSNSDAVAYGKMVCLYAADAAKTPYEASQHLSGVSGTDGTYYHPNFGYFGADDILAQVQGNMTPVGGVATTDTMGLSCEGYGIESFGLAVQAVHYSKAYGWSSWGSGVGYTINLGVVSSYGTISAYTDITNTDIDEQSASAVQEASSRVRSGSYITKQALLGGTASPADYLLSFIKAFGLVMEYDGLTKTITLHERGGFYTGAEVDISARIDRSKGISVEPNGISEKWLNFAFGSPAGAFAQKYRNKYSNEYGAQRVNTGNPFNADTLQVLDGTQFVQGVTGLAYSRYYFLVTDSGIGGDVLPSPYLDNGCKYTLWTGTGEAVQYDVASISEDMSVDDINAVDEMSAMGYDGFFRLNIEDADGNADGDGANILCLLDGFVQEFCSLSDDTAAMLNVNNGTPCWIPCLDDIASLYVPHFLSYTFVRAWGGLVDESVDMGMPQALDMPNMRYDEGLTIYDKRWKAYITDRYGENAHRVTCWVDWGGMRMSQEMLGKFYWFDGAWWVLDKVEDYCWDKPQPCRCTFVRVMDKTAYTNGQS